LSLLLQLEQQSQEINRADNTQELLWDCSDAVQLDQEEIESREMEKELKHSAVTT